MTTLDELCAVIASIGLPWANTAFERGDKVSLPYIVLAKAGGTVYGADDITWLDTAEYDIELYTKRRDYALESAVRDALDAAGIFWSDGGTWTIPEESTIETVTTVAVRE